MTLIVFWVFGWLVTSAGEPAAHPVSIFHPIDALIRAPALDDDWLLEAATFAARSRALKEFCIPVLIDPILPERISALEAAAVAVEDQAQYDQRKGEEYQMSSQTFQYLGGKAKDDFCLSLERALAERSARFAKAHPWYFF